MIGDPWFWALAVPAVALTGISKGGTGGGATVATPLMAMLTGCRLLYDGITGL